MGGTNIKINVLGGTTIREACNDAITVASTLRMVVTFNFNGIDMYVWPSDTEEKAVASYWGKIESLKDKTTIQAADA